MSRTGQPGPVRMRVPRWRSRRRPGARARSGSRCRSSCTRGTRTPPSEPPGDHYLPVGEEAHGVLPLTVEAAEERVLVAREREEGHRGGDADVHADVATLGLVPEVARPAAVLRVYRGRVPERAAVDELD